MKKIIVSGINLFEGGTLTIFYESLDNICQNLLDDYEVIALVHKKELFEKYNDKITILEFPNGRKNYLFRLYYEYIYFYFKFKSSNIYLWLSLHDITPNVKAEKKAVYCHNPMMFYKMNFKSLIKYPKLYFFSKFYKYLYKINIKSNNYVIVQQEWIRKKFKETFGINNVIVALPVSEDSITEVNAINSSEISFVYPALSRFFKNFEVICEACSKLEADGITNFKVNLTIDGTENSYSRKLVEQYSHLKTINFLGIQKKSDIIALYEKSTCMIFSSKLETWGLPISEFKAYNKPMFVSDLEYAHETVGNYQKVSFFQPDSYVELSSSMSKIIKNETFEFDKNNYVIDNNLFCKNWTDLFDIILK
mgnify:FL=1